MTGKALICKLTTPQPIEGADRIAQASLLGETVIVSKGYKEGDIGLLFDCDTQLSHDYCHYNNLYRKSELNKDKDKVGYIEENRRVRPIKLKGVKCSGLFMPIGSVEFLAKKYLGENYIDNFSIGEEIEAVCTHLICQKYISPRTKNAQGKSQGGKAKEDLCPTFKEHIDTDQVLRNLYLIKEGNLVTITEKMHGSSGRCGYLPVLRKKNVFEKFLNKLGIKTLDAEYEFVTGSRRVVKSIGGDTIKEGGYYDTDIWTLSAKKNFEGKLDKGESVYYEIVGYLPEGGSIMGSQSNDKLKKFMDKNEYKQFIARYGETTNFNYGCAPGEHEVYVYRITMTNDDGVSIDISWDQVKRRCEQLGVKHVPEVDRRIASLWQYDELSFLSIDYGNKLEHSIEELTDLDSEHFKTHLKEGIVVRIDNGSNTPIFLKNKSFNFKVLESIIKDSDVVDLEESQG